MYFLLEKLEQFLPKIKKILEENLYPLEAKYLSLHFSEVEPELTKIRAIVKERGLWNSHLSESHGGLGFNLVEFGQISEVLGRSPYGHYCFKL